MYVHYGVSVPSLQREFTNTLIHVCVSYTCTCIYWTYPEHPVCKVYNVLDVQTFISSDVGKSSRNTECCACSQEKEMKTITMK